MCVPVHVSLMPHERFHVLLSECTFSWKIGPLHVRMPKTVKSSQREERLQFVMILLSAAYQCSYASVSSYVWWPLTQPANLIRMLWQHENPSLPLSFSLIFLLSLFPMHHSHLAPRRACIIPSVWCRITPLMIVPLCFSHLRCPTRIVGGSVPRRLVQAITGGHVLGHALVMLLWYFGVFIKPAVKRFWEVKINTL